MISSLGKQGAKLTSVDDFLFKWDPEQNIKPVQSVEAMAEIFNALASSSKEKKQGRTRPPKSKR